VHAADGFNKQSGSAPRKAQPVPNLEIHDVVEPFEVVELVFDVGAFEQRS
jgi:hypothetical protein